MTRGMPVITGKLRCWIWLALVLFLIQVQVIVVVAASSSSSSNNKNNERKGGETATFFANPLRTNFTNRQDVCRRYHQWTKGEIELRDALSGLELRPVLRPSAYFAYNNAAETGISSVYPGIVAVLMDNLASRANFTWRQSFGVMYDEEVQLYNMSWTDALLWSIETYDVAVDWWDHNVERMEKGAAYIEPWLDSSVLLVDHIEVSDDDMSSSTDFKNWLSPFDPEVWAMIAFTIILSALVYQLIEYLNEERDERPAWHWFSDNLYLSCINFSQNFEYAPNSVSGRIFAVSMCMWALVMTATYTANLASLFVDNHKQTFQVDSIEQAVLLGIPICTYANTNSDTYIASKYKKAIRVPKIDELEMYQALRRGECGLVAAHKDNWLNFQQNKLFNPQCDLEWVGRKVKSTNSGFAVKANSGDRCTSLIRDVLNVHMVELIASGELDEAWKQHRENTLDYHCVADTSLGPYEIGSRRRTLRQRIRSSLIGSHQLSSWSSSSAPTASSIPPPTAITHHTSRLLKASSKGNSGGLGDDNQSMSLSLNHMMGTFLFHWIAMAASLLLSFIVYSYERVNERKWTPHKKKLDDDDDNHITIRRGPQLQREAEGSMQMQQLQRGESIRSMTSKTSHCVPGLPPRMNSFKCKQYINRWGGGSHSNFCNMDTSGRSLDSYLGKVMERSDHESTLVDKTAPKDKEMDLQQTSIFFQHKQEAIEGRLEHIENRMLAFEEKIESVISLQQSLIQHVLEQRMQKMDEVSSGSGGIRSKSPSPRPHCLRNGIKMKEETRLKNPGYHRVSTDEISSGGRIRCKSPLPRPHTSNVIKTKEETRLKNPGYLRVSTR